MKFHLVGGIIKADPAIKSEEAALGIYLSANSRRSKFKLGPFGGKRNTAALVPTQFRSKINKILNGQRRKNPEKYGTDFQCQFYV